MSNIVKYSNSGIDLGARIEDGQAWLTTKQVAELFGVDTNTVSDHAANILDDDELPRSTTEHFPVFEAEGDRSVKRIMTHWNQDMVMAIGFRIRSQRGVEFRTWALDIVESKGLLEQLYAIALEVLV